MRYRDALTQAMTELGRHKNTLFLGQAVAYPGTGMTETFAGVPRERLVELPVFEETQLGLCLGLSLAGYLPVCVYPRINFLLLALGQMVLHLDALPRYSAYRPRVIIRTAVASPHPLDPGAQHLGDYSLALAAMLRTVEVARLARPEQVLPAYRRAADVEHSTLLVEYASVYDRPLGRCACEVKTGALGEPFVVHREGCPWRS